MQFCLTAKMWEKSCESSDACWDHRDWTAIYSQHGGHYFMIGVHSVRLLNISPNRMKSGCALVKKLEHYHKCSSIISVFSENKKIRKKEEKIFALRLCSLRANPCPWLIICCLRDQKGSALF